MEIGQSADKSYAYLLGVYLGDGYVGSAGQFTMTTIDLDFAEAVQVAFAELGIASKISVPRRDPRFSKSSDYYNLHSQVCQVCERLLDETQCKQRIPEWVASADAELRKRFVVGLMDSEGFVARKRPTGLPTNRDYYMGYKSCDVWVPEFIRIMESVGLRIGKVSQEAPRKPHYKVPTRFHIKMQSWVDAGMRFNISRKQSRVDEWASVPAYALRSRHPRRLISETTR